MHDGVLCVGAARGPELVQTGDTIAKAEGAGGRGAERYDGAGDVVARVGAVGDGLQDAGGHLPVFWVAAGGMQLDEDVVGGGESGERDGVQGNGGVGVHVGFLHGGGKGGDGGYFERRHNDSETEVKIGEGGFC